MIRSALTALALMTGLATSLPVMAQIDEIDDEANLVGEAVQLRALDKVTARTFDYTVELGETLEFGSLTIHARHCEVAPPPALPEPYAFLQIDDRRLDADAQDEGAVERIFSGWMFKSRPAISALDHRVYDVWVIDCKIPPKLDSDFRR